MNRRDTFKLLAALPAAPALAKTPAPAVGPLPVAPDEPACFRSAHEVGTELLGELALRYNGDWPAGSVSTGFGRLDDCTNGLRKGELTVIAARPSMGKTTLALNIAAHVALHPDAPRPVAFFSMDTGAGQLLRHLLAALSRTPMSQLRNGTYDADAQARITAANDRLAKAPLYISDTGALTVAKIRARTRRLQQQAPELSLVVIDAVNLIYRGEASDAQVSRELRALAVELDLPVIVLAPLGRGVERRVSKYPQLTDLREVSAIGAVADLVLLLYRHEVYHRDSAHQGVAELILARNRHGESGSFALTFEGQYGLFRDFVAEFELPA